jgi:glutathione S-transferase
MKLHYHPFSTSCMKCVALIHETGAPVELTVIDIAKGAHKAPEFLAINPNGKLPALTEGDFTLWESNAICCYLAAKSPEKKLIPSDPKALAEMHQWLSWQASALTPATFKVMMEAFYAKLFGRAPDEAKLKTGLDETAKELAILEHAFGDGREYLCKQLSVADFSVSSNLLLRRMVGIDTSSFPKVEAWLARMETRESVKQSVPPL